MTISINQQYEFKRRSVFIAIAIFLVCSLLVMIFPTVNADTCNNDDVVHSEWAPTILTGVGETVIEHIKTPVSLSFLGIDLAGELDSNGAGLSALIGSTTSSGLPLPAVITGNVLDVYKLLLGIAALWVIAVAMSHLFQMLERGQDPIEAIFKCVVEITIAGLLVLNFNKIMSLVTAIGLSIVLYIGGVGNTTGPSPEECCELVTLLTGLPAKDHSSISYIITASISMLIAYSAQKVIAIIAGVYVYSILFEVAIRRFFSPLAAADIYQEGLRSPGVRYIKKYLACLLRLLAIILVADFTTLATSALLNVSTADIANGISSTLLTAIGGSVGVAAGTLSIYKKLGAVIIVGITAAKVMGKSGEVINDALGV